ncbi:hypothetical protein TEQG_08686 [Trichophyton equinum CBS 127.97]|uniref:Uncharacterized protein n=1 Tax=Trichophyton equinum (strain ATCC MYA-4606 / CBS 127.97) TaxID=559882 RepID=F2PU29_TRIEC|nr:hypothetical protein TEQG_08686 [Trichophyton equinum CBS 127.97]
MLAGKYVRRNKPKKKQKGGANDGPPLVQERQAVRRKLRSIRGEQLRFEAKQRKRKGSRALLLLHIIYK